MSGAAPGFELYGHRGARALFAENTLPGFAAAIALGLERIELDVAVTADDVVVVTHDPRLNRDLTRGPDGAWLRATGPPIRQLAFAALGAYDVGRIRPRSLYGARFRKQQPMDGARIPSLADVLALDRRLTIAIELKTFPQQPALTAAPARVADLVMATAQAHDAIARIIVQSFDWRGLRHVKQRYPQAALAWLTAARSSDAERRRWWDGVSPAEYGGSVPRAVAAAASGAREPVRWMPQWTERTPPLIAEAHALGLRVIPWDVNDAGAIERALAAGVDGIITDRPDLARRLLVR
jgi:glycerophosphoryl diester phosphodiesterase